MMGKDKQLNKLLVLIGYVIPVILCYPFGADLDIIATPRTTVHFKDLLGCNHFHGAALNYSSLLIEEGAGVLYVGAREAIYKLDSANISNSNVSLTLEWAASPEQKKQCLSKGKNNQTECYNHVRFLDRYNDTHLYTCGTHAFRPRCAYIDVAQFTFVRFEEGKEKCPYDPNKGYTGFIIDGEMYSASQYEFRSIPDIRRNFPFPNLRTDDSPTTWLMESDFVGSAFLRESINSSIGDDDKLYFFFTERNAEPTAHSSQTKVARVARVCKGDIGGQRTLQRKWTSFLKARLVCSIPDYELQFNILRSVFVLGGSSTHERVFYGIFGLEWRNVKMSAVCQYSFRDVQAAFDGPFMEQQDSKWREYTGKVPDPRPGSCITDQHRSLLINSSRDLPDNTLNFVRRHPVMSKEIKPVGGRPVLLQRNADYTNIAVQQTVGLDGLRYDTLFIGTEEGWLHRAVKIRERVHIIEELQLFQDKQPITNMKISQKQNSLYVSAPTGLVQVPLSYCERYTSCFDCVFARDPHCGWDGRLCVEVASYANSSSLIQDVQMGRRGCTNITSDGFVPHRTRTVMAGDDVLLQCEIRSNLATPQWTLNGKQLQGYDIDFGYRTGTDGLLMINAQNQQSGHYRCYAAENDVWVPVRSYIVIVQPVSPRASHSSGYSSVLPERFFTTTTLPTLSPSSGPVEQFHSPPPVLMSSEADYHLYKHMEAMYISLVAVLGGMCLVLTVVLLYVSFCSTNGKYSQQTLSLTSPAQRKRSSHFELKTISSHCNGRTDARTRALSREGEFLQIVQADVQITPSEEPPPAPPLPMPPPLPESEYSNGLSATLPSIMRKMNGSSYMLLTQTDPETTSPHYHSFTEELNRILEKRKHTQPDESLV